MTGRMPSYVMFSDLKRFGRMSHYDAARVLLSDTVAEAAKAAVAEQLAGKDIKKVIVIKGRLVNIVAV